MPLWCRAGGAQMTEGARKVRIGPLDTVGGVVVELGRVYRLARRNEMDIAEAKGLAFVLREIRCALEASDIERRIEALEEAKIVPLRRVR